MTTAGYTTADYDVWPILGKMASVMVMFIGAMAGSTAGGIKVSRIVMAMKGAYINVRKLINLRYVPKAKFEGKTLESKIFYDVFAFIALKTSAPHFRQSARTPALPEITTFRWLF